MKGKRGIGNGKLNSGDIVVNVELNCFSGYCYNFWKRFAQTGEVAFLSPYFCT